MGFSFESTGIEDNYPDVEQEEVLDGAESIEEEQPLEEPQTQEEVVDEDIYEFDIDGEAVKMSKSELSKKLKGESIDDPDFSSYKAYKPIVEAIKEDDILKEYVQHKAVGKHKPEDIVDGMFLKRHPELYGVIQDYYRGGKTAQTNQPAQPEEEEPPVFNSMEEEMRYYAMQAARQEIQAQLGTVLPNVQQIQQRQQQYEQVKQLEYIDSNNNAVMENALAAYGYDANNMNSEDVRTLANTLQDLYPGVDFRTALIGEAQAKAIVRTALGKNASKQFSTKDYVTQSSLPSVKPVGASRKAIPKTKEKVDGASKAERLERIRELFG